MRIWNASDANVYKRLKFPYVVQVFESSIYKSIHCYMPQ